MKETIGQVFSIGRDNKPLPFLTISKEISDGIIYFSLAKNTDISAEIYSNHKLLIVVDGNMEVYISNKQSFHLTTLEMIVTDTNIPIGIKANEDVVYTEINLRRNDKMNELIKAGEVFKLKDLLPYQEGKIVNMDFIHNDKMKFVVMSFDEGTALSEHAAPGEALIFALDGEGIIGYEGKEHDLHQGENFHFAKGGMHYVKAKGKFKMALLLVFE